MNGDAANPNVHTMRHPARAWAFACLALAVILSPGCTTPFERHRDHVAALFAQGRYDQIAIELDNPENRDRYGEKNQLLWWLDRGAAALALGDTQTTIETLERAEDFMDVFREKSTADKLGQWLINDTAAPYIGEPYEDMYVNVFKLLAQLEAGNIEGGATVEARRMAGKADVLRDRYLRFKDTVVKQAKDGAGAAPTVVRGATAEEGEFIESPLGTYLAALTFLKSGDDEMHAVASRRLLTAIEAQGGLIGPVRKEPFESIEQLRPQDVNVLVVALSGRGPRKEPRRIGPIPIFAWPVYFELPELVGGVAEAAGARVAFDDGTSVDLALIEDMRRVATVNHERQLPLIYTRTYIRSSAKAATAFALTKTWEAGSSRGSERAAAAIVGTLAGLAFVGLTEKADLRCWELLPALAHVGVVKLPPGERNARVEYLSATGGVIYAGPWTSIAAGDRPTDLFTIVEHYWQ